ncbi:MAG TPA: phospholipase D family protein [Burkholderiaceae bacterium]|nr:phospholipase D family protein [Burkholderiaceae bacterium]
MKRTTRRGVSFLAAAALAAGLLGGCATSLPSLEGRTTTTALADTAGSSLGRALQSEIAAHPGQTGVHALPRPRDAFATRAVLAAAAEKSIDAQYYVWHGDQVGYLLFEALWNAAERGVRVRLLLDDANTAGLDPTIAALDAHPNIEVRLYNPLVMREARGLNFLADFTRVNRRMHNKSFTVDSQVTVVGGRNIGNEYFAAGSGVAFADLDVVAVGAAVGEVSKEFDTYWNSPSAYPAASFVGAPGSDSAAQLKAKFAETRADPESVDYLEEVRVTPVLRDMVEHRLVIEWTTAQLVYDDPAKTLDTTARTDILLFPELVRTIGRPQKTLDLSTPYFVPGDGGTAALVAQAGSGVKIRILTNSLAATDVSAVHAGYAKRRLDLLRAGVQLYELKPTAVREGSAGRSGYESSSAAGLHAKTFAVDRSRIFVGSFNFDQRSARLNTEMGLVIDSPALARELAEAFETAIPSAAYEVRIAPDGNGLEWIERTGSGEVRYDTEPDTTWLKRSTVNLLSILPIEWLL